MDTRKKHTTGLVLVPFSILMLIFGFTITKDKQDGNLKKEERNVAAFTKIHISIAADIYYTQEATQKVVLEGEEKDLEKIITEVKDGKLKITNKSNFSGSMKSVKIYISSARLDGVGLSGSGNFLAEGIVKTDKMSIALSGSGNTDFRDLLCSEMEIALSGSGDITIAGNGATEKTSVAISGSGDIDLEKFVTKSAEIAISGSGDCKVNASETLKGAVSGSGDIGYKGNPRLEVKVAGSGKVHSL